MGKFAKMVDKTCKVFSYGSVIALFGMMVLGTADVAGRYLFNIPLTGTLEIFEILMPVMVLLSLADTQSGEEHLTAGVIDYFGLKPKTRTKIQFGVQVLMFFLFLLIVWRGVMAAMLTRRSHRLVSNIDVPLWIPELVVPIGALMMCLVLFVQIVEIAKKIKE